MLNLDINGVFDLGKELIERKWPNPREQAAHVFRLEQLRQNGDLESLKAEVQLMIAQTEVNKVEAQHKSLFVAGWRPYIGWVCGAALTYQFLIYPLFVWLWKLAQAAGWIALEVEYPPILDIGSLIVLLGGMLGIGGLRSFEKFKGIDTRHIDMGGGK